MRAVIFANGELNTPFNVNAQDIIIAADGGAHHCMKLGLKPTVVIGDFDSLTQTELDQLKSDGVLILKFPVRKDFTDLELALQYAEKLQVDEVVILGALGDRWDQTIANLMLAGAYRNQRIRLVDGNQEFFYIRSNETFIINGIPGDTVSLIPLSGDANGITTRGLEYALNGESLKFGATRGISNQLVSDRAEITLQEGFLLCIQNRKPVFS